MRTAHPRGDRLAELPGCATVRSIGIVGGIGPESTVDYYRQLLSRTRERGHVGAPHVLIDSIDVARVLTLADSGDRAGLAEYMLQSVARLARAGAELALFASNTPHLVFDEVAGRSPIELVSIVEAARDAAEGMGLERVGLLGTRFTMEGEFYAKVFAERGLAVHVPEPADLAWVHGKYVGELVPGRYMDGTRAGFLGVIERLRERAGIEAVILGGTELPLLLRGVAAPLPLLDTTRIHVDAVVARALSHGLE